jgi:hypothetical protein
MMKANLMKAVDYLDDAARLSRRLRRVSARLSEIENEQQALRVEARALDEQFRSFDALRREYWSMAHNASCLTRTKLQILELDIGDAVGAPYLSTKDIEKVVDAFIAQHAPAGAKE